VRLPAALRRREESGVACIAGVVLAGLILGPLGAVLSTSTPPALDFGVAHVDLQLAAWVGSAAQLFLTSCGFAAAVTLSALVVGIPLGVLLGRFDVPGRDWALLIHAFPFFAPPFLLALGWFHVFGADGFAGSVTTSRVLFSWSGACIVLTLALSPVVTLLVVLGVRGVDPRLVEAARLAARPSALAARVLLPLSAPALRLAALVTFALAFSELGVPMFLRVKVYPEAVFSRLGGMDPVAGEAAMLALPMLVLSLALLGGERWLALRGDAAGLSWRSPECPLPLGRWRSIIGVAVWTWIGISLLPILALGIRAAPALGEMGEWTGRSVLNSLGAGAATASAATALALAVGWRIGRRRRGSRWFDAVAFLGFVAPAALLGIGLGHLWNRPRTQGLHGSLAIIVLGLLARYAVIPIRSVATGVAQTSSSTEEAAEIAGASFLRRLLAIVAGEQRRILAAAWVLGFVFAIRDLETSVLLYPPGGEPLTVRIFTLEANGPESVVAALASLQILLTAGVLLAGGGLVRLVGRAR
jgi:iron(III) transport system permease protein